ncbi:MAG: efflux RND transporter permease subunit [Planctomycetes bacterium]|nr:efflux RND transporter permease subunit [Planctomycetota bacterium]
MNFINLAVRQPKTVTVAVILALIGGLMAVLSVPIQMTPEVKSVVITVTTFWENASPEEVESDIVEEQEQRLGNLSGLVSMTSMSQASQGELRLEFITGTDIDSAIAKVAQRLDEVPGYPAGVLQPVVKGYDPETRDYMSWVAFASSDPAFDMSTMHDFMERRLVPRLERIEGIGEVGMMGTREKEIHLIVDPAELARRGVTYTELLAAIDSNNDNYSGGKLPEGKNDIRIRTIGRFNDVEQVGALVLRREASGPIYLRDVAEVREGYKEATTWARSRGHYMPYFNFTLEHGANMLKTMGALRAEFDALNAPGGLLENEAKRVGMDGNLQLIVDYDATTYVEDAIGLVKSNILIGGAIATLVLLFFLRSLRVVGIVGLAIPISVISSIMVMVSMGRTINIVSLAGMAFAVGMVVDNAIVVIENIFRHLEMGKRIKAASIEGTREVAGAVVASTLTTLVVFLPILLIQDSAGQLFRDIALAIMAAVGISLVVSLTVIPSAAATFLGRTGKRVGDAARKAAESGEAKKPASVFIRAAGGLSIWLMSSWLRSATVVAIFFVGTGLGITALMPPLDYLPAGNRNIVFGMLIPPPGYNLDQLSKIGERVEATIRPAWEVAGPHFDVERRELGLPLDAAQIHPDTEWPDRREPILNVPMGPEGPMFDQATEIMPPALASYFLVGVNGLLFHGAIAKNAHEIPDVIPLLNKATGGANAPDVFGFAFQMPLFNTGGNSGTAVKIDLSGDSLADVEAAAGAMMGSLMGAFPPGSVMPAPMNFSLPTPELRLIPNDERLRELGMSRADVGLAMQANSDGIILPRQFETDGDLKDLKILSPGALGDDPLGALQDLSIATPAGGIIKLADVASMERVTAPEMIKHVNRQRAVTLQLTPPPGMPLQVAIDTVDSLLLDLKSSGAMAPGVDANLAGSAGKLNDIKDALVGDGTPLGFATSSLVLALLVVYLLMVVLFQSWIYPVVILVSVPLATLGGFAALRGVHLWSLSDRYMPVQNMDVLTILGFVILAGVVVNNAILIVHQALNFLKHGERDVKRAIAMAVESRVRPIAMGTLTSVGGMLPLVLMPGSGSELYRGLGAVVVGGLAVSTIFTLVLVPILLHAVLRFGGGTGSTSLETDLDAQPADLETASIGNQS